MRLGACSWPPQPTPELYVKVAESEKANIADRLLKIKVTLKSSIQDLEAYDQPARNIMVL